MYNFGSGQTLEMHTKNKSMTHFYDGLQVTDFTSFMTMVLVLKEICIFFKKLPLRETIIPYWQQTKFNQWQ